LGTKGNKSNPNRQLINLKCKGQSTSDGTTSNTADTNNTSNTTGSNGLCNTTDTTPINIYRA